MSWALDVLRTPGLTGLAAVVAACIAYAGVRRNSRIQAEQSARDRAAAREQSTQDRAAARERADEDRWWAAAQWAADKLAGDVESVAIGVAALQHLVTTTPDSQAGRFAFAALVSAASSAKLDTGTQQQDNERRRTR